MSKFGKRLKILRESKKLNQEELASVLGVSKQTISNYENGKREANYENLEALADFFNVDMNYLLGKTNKTTILPERLLDEGKQIIFKDNDFTLFSPTRTVSPAYKPVFGNQLLAMTAPVKEECPEEEEERRPSREEMLDWLKNNIRTAAYGGGNYEEITDDEELYQYYQDVRSEFDEE